MDITCIELPRVIAKKKKKKKLAHKTHNEVGRVFPAKGIANPKALKQ